MNWTITGKELILFLILAFTSPIWGTILICSIILALGNPIGLSLFLISCVSFTGLLILRCFKKNKSENKAKVTEKGEKKITTQDYIAAQIERNRKEYEKELTHTGKHKPKKAFQKESLSEN